MKQKQNHPSDLRPLDELVLSVCNLTFDSAKCIDYRKSEPVGTAFLIGQRGFGLTAAHVVDQCDNERSYVWTFYSIGRGKRAPCAVKIKATEPHPKEDVALLQFAAFPDGQRVSYFEVSGAPQRASCEYQMWSYPEDISTEIKYHSATHEEGVFWPSLVFFGGYVRRKMPYSPNPSYSHYRGSKFLELSEIAGACASGSPVVNAKWLPKWDVMGIYIGDAASRKCGYGAPLELVADWKPDLLGGVSIAAEASSSI